MFFACAACQFNATRDQPFRAFRVFDVFWLPLQYREIVIFQRESGLNLLLAGLAVPISQPKWAAIFDTLRTNLL